MNSVLQFFLNSPEIARFMLNSRSINKSDSLTSKFSDLLELKFENGAKTLTPRDFKAKFGSLSNSFRGFEQEDAREFFSDLVKILSEETNLAQNKARTRNIKLENESDFQKYSAGMDKKDDLSFVKELFTFQVKNEFVCANNHKQVNFQFYSYLPLNFKKQSTLQVKVSLYRLPNLPLILASEGIFSTNELSNPKLMRLEFSVSMDKESSLLDLLNEVKEKYEISSQKARIRVNHKEISDLHRKLNSFEGRIKVEIHEDISEDWVIACLKQSSPSNQFSETKIIFRAEEKSQSSLSETFLKTITLNREFSIPLQFNTEYEAKQLKKLLFCLISHAFDSPKAILEAIEEENCFNLSVLDKESNTCLKCSRITACRGCSEEIVKIQENCCISLDFSCEIYNQHVNKEQFNFDLIEEPRKISFADHTLEKMLHLYSEPEIIECLSQCSKCGEYVPQTTKSTLASTSDYFVIGLMRFLEQGKSIFNQKHSENKRGSQVSPL